MNNINESKEYHKNPRKITKKQHELLESSLQEFGDLSGVVVNIRTGEVIGGNQRSTIFRKEEAKIEITQRYEKPTKTGTVAIGYILFGAEKYAYREVDWDEKTAESANIRANKIGGMFDFDRSKLVTQEAELLRKIYPPLIFRKVDKPWKIEPDMKSIKL